MPEPPTKDLVEILTKANNLRTEVEIRHVATWFNHNVRAFKDVSIDILMKLVAECEAEFRYPNDVIIREGDIGDCMYVLLWGRVSVHYNGDQSLSITENKSKEIQNLPKVEESQLTVVEQKSSEIIETLGPQVGQLESGSVFGEVALIEDCLRTASIVALPNSLIPQEDTDLNFKDEDFSKIRSFKHQSVCIVNISRRLYNNTVRVAIEQEFRERLKFVDNITYFQHLSDKGRKQIAMGLERQKYEYDQKVIKQGSPFNGLYFIQRGELRTTLTTKSTQRTVTSQNSSDSGTFSLPFIVGCNPCAPEKTGSICAGDLEFLLKHPKYMFSVISNTSSTIIYFMNIKNAERYIFGLYSKRNHRQSQTVLLTLCEFSRLVQLRLSTLIKYVPVSLQGVLLNSASQLLNDERRRLKLLHIRKMVTPVDIRTSKKVKCSKCKDAMNSTENEHINKLFGIHDQKLMSKKKINRKGIDFSNDSQRTCESPSDQQNISQKSDQNTSLSYEIITDPESSLPAIISNQNELRSIIQSSLPFRYRNNAARLLQRINDQKLQSKVQCFIENLNEFNAKQINESISRLNYYAQTSDKINSVLYGS
ncbi:unnamed protein product [Heterobilharzia americana]|nr:unnamed protein product [Heterobilharzia americana]